MFLRKASTRKLPRPFTRLFLETLEDRLALSAVAWNGHGDHTSWNDPQNWNSGTVPGSADDVTINLSGSVVNYVSGNSTVNSISCANTLDIQGGSLTTNADVKITGTLAMDGGTLTGTTGIAIKGAAVNFNSGSVVVPNNGSATISGASALTFAANATGTGSFTIASGTTGLAGNMPAGVTVSVGSGAGAIIHNNQTFTVNGTLNVNGPALFTAEEINGGQVEAIVVNGTMAVSNATFAYGPGANNNSNISKIQVNAGGHLTAAGSTFGWDAVVWADGSVLNSGEVTGSGFDTTVYAPAADAPLLTNNKRFHDVVLNGGDLINGQNVTFTQMGTSTKVNLRYVFPNPFTVDAGATLTFDVGTRILLQDNLSNTATLTVNGTLNVNSAAFNVQEVYGGHTEAVVVNGTMAVNGTAFGFDANSLGGEPNSNNSYLAANAGGHLTATGATFGWDQFGLANGSVLNANEITGSAFDTVAFVPAADVPLLTNNLRFRDVYINGGDLTNGQNVAFTQMGTGTTQNLQYDFTNPFTVDAGATLTLGAGTRVVLRDNLSNTATLTVNGTLNVNSAAFNVQEVYGGHTEAVVVNGTMAVNGTAFGFDANSLGGEPNSNNSYLAANAGGHLTATGATFGWDQFGLANGSVLNANEITGSAFDTVAFVPAADVPLLTNNLRFRDVYINGGDLTNGQNVAFTQMGTGTTQNLQYDFTNPFTVDAGATLTLGAGTRVVLRDNLSNTATLTVNGTLNVNSAAFNVQEVYGGHTEAVVVNGTMAVNGTAFGFDANSLGGEPNSNNSYLAANAGGHLTATGATFGWDQFGLANGSVLNANEITGSAFDTVAFVPAADVPLLTNNLRFRDVYINGGDLTNGQNVAFTQMGTGTTQNLQYDFTNPFTVDAGATLTLGAGTRVVLRDNLSNTATLTVNGTLNVNSAAFNVQEVYGGHTEAVVVNGTMAVNGTAFGFDANSLGGEPNSNNSYLAANAGGHLTATGATFGWDQFGLANGSVLNANEITGSAFDTVAFVPAADVPLLTNNLRFRDVYINGGDLTNGQNVAFTQMGTGTTQNLQYDFTNPFTVDAGATLTLGAGTRVVLRDNLSNTATLTVNGTLNVNSAAFNVQEVYGGHTEAVVVNGTMAVNGTAFGFDANSLGGEPNSNNSYLAANAGGHLTATGATFGWDQFGLANGSVLNANEITGSAFDTVAFVPAADVPLLTNNLRFRDVYINGGDLTNGQNVAFTQMGTGTTQNLQYDFTNPFTVDAGATLTLGAGTRVVLRDNLSNTATLTVNGTLNVNSAAFNVQEVYGGHTEAVVVNGTMAVNGTAFGFDANSLGGEPNSNNSLIQVNAPGQFTAVASRFGWDNLTLASGTNDTITFTAFPTVLTVDSGATIKIVNNDFTNTPANGVVATGNSSSHINLTNNYWGTTDANQIAGKILDHTDANNASRPTVDFSPFLTALPPYQIVWSGPKNVSAGVPVNLTVTVQDVYGGTVTSYVGTVHFTSSDKNATLPADYTFVAGDLGTHTFSFTFQKAGAQTVTATDTTTSSLKGQTSENVSPSGATNLVLSNVPNTLTAGTVLQVTVTLKDAFGNVATGYTGTVHFDDAGAQVPVDYTFTAGDNGRRIFTVVFLTAGKQTLTVTDTVNNALSAKAVVTVSPGAPAQYLLSAPATVTAGTAFNLTAIVVDAYGNTVTSYAGTVNFTSSDPAAVLPASYTFQPGDLGTHTFSVTLENVAAQTVTLTDAALPSLTSTATTVAAPGQFKISAPASVTAGKAFTFTVTALNGLGKTGTGYTGTVHFSSSDGSAVLPADYTFTAADQGVHTFTTVAKFFQAGSQTLTATDTANALSTGTTSTTVNAATATQLTVSAPSAATAGSGFVVTLTALDGFGNVVPTYTGTVHFTSSDGRANLPDDVTFTVVNQGVVYVAVTLVTAGSQTVTATDTKTGSITAMAGVTVNPAATSQFAVSGPTSTVAGAAFTFTVSALDRFGNLTPGYLGKVKFTSTDPKAVLPAAYTFVAADQGVHTFAGGVTLKTAGGQSVTATDTVKSTVTGTQSGIAVSPAAAASFAVAGFPASTAGVAQSFSVTARDPYGNTATGYLGTVHFSSTDARALLPADYTFTAADAGVHYFAATLVTAGNRSIGAKDTANPVIAGNEGGIAISPAAASSFQVTTNPTAVTAGSAVSVTVTARDPYNNVATGYTGTVHFTSSDLQAVLPADYTFQPGDTGVHTIPNGATLKTVGNKGGQTITATDTATATITGTSAKVVVTAAALDHLAVSAPASVTVGVAFTVTVTAQDVYGNTVTTYAGTVHFTSSDSQATLPADYTFVAGDNGVHTFGKQARLRTVGAQTITATDTVASSVTGTSASISVTAGPGAGTFGPNAAAHGKWSPVVADGDWADPEATVSAAVRCDWGFDFSPAMNPALLDAVFAARG